MKKNLSLLLLLLPLLLVLTPVPLHAQDTGDPSPSGTPAPSQNGYTDEEAIVDSELTRDYGLSPETNNLLLLFVATCLTVWFIRLIRVALGLADLAFALNRYRYASCLLITVVVVVVLELVLYCCCTDDVLLLC